MRLFYGAAIMLIVLALGGLIFIYSGIYNVAASDDHTALEKWVLSTTMHNSVEAYADNIAVPDLDSLDMIEQGARSYEAMCMGCHLKPGLEDTPLRAGLMPVPPILAQQSHWGPAEQFWVIKKGIKMTAMPAWGVTHGDEELWEVVAFLQKLPSLSEQEYNAYLVTRTSSGGSASDGHDHSHADMSQVVGSPAAGNSEEVQADDGHYADGHSH